MNEIKTKPREYNPDAYSVKDIPKKMSAVVKDVKNGTLGELVTPTALAKWKNADESAPAIEIVAELSDGSLRRRVIQLPLENDIHPSSNLAQWKKIFGGYPKVGQKIELTADEKGFYQFPV